ncbi:hypothetical protein [Salinispora vitiensis]|uniref:hypothetical protein n=1 Tax=Salinispora vitiensis TaxID=999544 RepID=UPI0003691D40|nr:hypothetical protein [Salinispora vitiensis]
MSTEAIADALRTRATEGHYCVAPGCPRTATRAFVFHRLAHLAGRWWRPGDYLDVCREHARQVYQAHQADTFAQVPGWLRPFVGHCLPDGRRPDPGGMIGLV